jgi:mRNA interferase RelE/StbE
LNEPAWRVETTPAFDRQLRTIDRLWQARIVAYMIDVSRLSDPRQRGRMLTAEHRHEWRYRIGDYRVIVRIDDATHTIVALVVAHRSRVYRD